MHSIIRIYYVQMRTKRMPMYQSTILPFNHCHTPITCFDPHKLDLQRWGGQGWPCEHLDGSRFSPRVFHGFSDAAKVRI